MICNCTTYVGAAHHVNCLCDTCGHEITLHFKDIQTDERQPAMITGLGDMTGQCAAVIAPPQTTLDTLFETEDVSTVMVLNNAAEKLLDEREHTHGSFANNAKTFCKLTAAIDKTGCEFTPVQAAALSMICMKIARICSTPNEPDHWADIEGYARLARRELETPTTK